MQRRFLRLGLCISRAADYYLSVSQTTLIVPEPDILRGIGALIVWSDEHNFPITVIMPTLESALGAGSYN